MLAAHAVNVGVKLDWPDGPDKKPKVKTSPSTVSEIKKDDDAIEWKLESSMNLDKLRITNVKFFNDVKKKQPADVSPYLVAGESSSPTKWRMRVKPGVEVSEEITFYYDLIFDFGGEEVVWDPMVKIKPRP